MIRVTQHTALLTLLFTMLIPGSEANICSVYDMPSNVLDKHLACAVINFHHQLTE